MTPYPRVIRELISQLSRLPGIGPKTAERLIFHLLKQPKEYLNTLATNISQLKDAVTVCRKCYNFSSEDPCFICADTKRNNKVVCVVSKPQDLVALESTNQYQGTYHVLGGVVDPINGITPEQLKIRELVGRIKQDNVLEVILALNSDMSGETTIMYLTKLLKQFKTIKITRLAQGLPIGSDLEYIDEITLTNALKGRREL
ncbi:MAG: recombination protein RecR [Candidatus Buchananbacteria bacterium]|nr:recombination protein RecR [Candidatus Buchananbacteria bacterium]